MKRCLTLGLAFGLLCSGQSLTIRLYNLTNTPPAMLDRASAVAGQLLAGAGVTSIWKTGCPDALKAHLTDQSGVTPCSRPVPDTREYLVVALVRGMPAEVYPAATGYALPFARQGAHATVFYDRVEKLYFSSPRMPTIAKLLGATMAHEIGHVLLGTSEHSAHGIMKARWGLAEFQLLACNRLQFTPEDGGAIARTRSARLELLSLAQHRSTASNNPIE
jgi:hypothetical protein